MSVELKSWKFKDNYEFKFVENWDNEPNYKKIIDTHLDTASSDQLLATQEKVSRDELQKRLASRISIKIGVYFNSQLVGFTEASQTNSENLHMNISAVASEHQRRGVYSELLRAVLAFAKDNGFQSVESQHRTTNNPIIIAKLKAGFLISGIVLSDIMGSLLRLVYVFNDDRRKLMHARSGLIRPQTNLRDTFF